MTEWVAYTLVVFGGLITVLTLWDKIESRVKAVKAPTKSLEERVETLEKKVDLEYKSILNSHDERFQRDFDAINSIKRTMNLIVEAQWVLVDHAKNGNNEKELNDVSEKLKDFVFDK